jgi:hypothetical protein
MTIPAPPVDPKQTPKASKPDTKPAANRARPGRKPAPKASLEQEIYAFLMLVNVPVSMFQPTADLALIDDETKALAVTINETCLSNPTIYKYVKAVVAAGKGGGLAIVLGCIVGRRAAARNMIPGVSPDSADQFLFPVRLVAATSSVKTPSNLPPAPQGPPNRSAGPLADGSGAESSTPPKVN